jgi:putative endonuclease
MTWMVYIVSCSDGSLYCGVSKDLDLRLKTHNEGKGAKYTRSRRPVTLEWSEPRPDYGSALRREREIKKMRRSQKQNLIKECNALRTKD